MINLEIPESISEITIGFLKEVLSWIYLPKDVEFLISNDGKTFTSLAKLTDKNLDQERFASARFKTCQAKYIKVIAKNFGSIPSGKPGAGSNAWLFCDEIIIK